MNLKKLRMRYQHCLRIVGIAFISAMMVGCNDDNTEIDTSMPFDPSKPIVISSFTPERGGYQDQIIVKGQNFGISKDDLTLEIGGKEAVVVNVMSDKLYAYIPSGAFSGEIKISVDGPDGKTHTAVAPAKFKYEPKRVVGTLCGYRNEQDDQGEMWGSFDICCGFSNEGCMAFDPQHPDWIYIAYDRGDGFVAKLDLTKREATKMISANKFQNKRLRNIAFTLDGKYMLVSTDRDDNNFHSTSVWIVRRNADGTFSDSSSCQPLVAYKQCNGVAVHPRNGEVYFNSYSNGELFRMNLDDYFNTVNGQVVDEKGEPVKWTGYKEDGCFRELFKIMDPSYEFQITIHPSGKYAYLTVINRNYILRTDYDEKKMEFTTPYIIAGANGIAGWMDAVGSNARFDKPYQGVFVKNQDYIDEGREDIYDYYLADCRGWCVRYITPDGLVRTFAGRSPSTNGNIWGSEDGDLRNGARFRDVSGIVYDEESKIFYVLDQTNRRIRTIGWETEDNMLPDPTPDPEPTE